MSTAAPQRFPLLAGAILGLTGVAIGALGAHRLEATLLERGMSRAWETGSRYHMFHALALLALAALLSTETGRSQASRLRGAAWCWTIGTILFSGSLYWLALVGPQPYAVVFLTPLGGVFFLIGWLLLLVVAFKTGSRT